MPIPVVNLGALFSPRVASAFRTSIDLIQRIWTRQRQIKRSALDIVRNRPCSCELGDTDSCSTQDKKKKKTRPSGKERASDRPSWSIGYTMLPEETPRAATERIMKERMGGEGYSKGPGSEYSQLKKFFERNRSGR